MAVELDLEDLIAARDRIRDQVTHTPLEHSEALSSRLGAELRLKHENLQLTGSFKFRGASHKLARLDTGGQRPAGVVAASAGNHAQAVARAARSREIPATVVMPETAPMTKVAACRSLGARIEQIGTTLEEATERAHELAEAQGLAFISPYDDWDIIAGQASCGLEMLESMPEMTTAVVCLGGGGLLSGIALALKLQRPDIRLVGVQAEAVAPWRHFLDDGEFEAVQPGSRTIADGISVKAPGKLTRQVIGEYVDEIVTVDDNAIARAIVTLLETTRTIGEGAGVVGLAALLDGRIELGVDERVACVISGGNIDMSLVGRSIDFGLSASGRLLSIAVTLPDRPGSLSGLIAQVAELGMNVREVRHRRGETHVPVGLTEITLELETRDSQHQQQLLERLREQGLSARVLAA
ncbi:MULTISPECIES: threonine ammonia-lyase [unclassified Wenzhouxiangella]|uniref:threonine ammonia-lyase n=1 Tax=unclassified Wenzhouxiangella TaxID=2613841 RepID=UPI001C6EE10E|nr:MULTISPECIES: threonine ammonia-lyase [unclassified Wenzhouxiangella]